MSYRGELIKAGMVGDSGRLEVTARFNVRGKQIELYDAQTDVTDANVTYTVAQIFNTYLTRNAMTVNRTDTLPTAALLVAEMKKHGTVKAGSTFRSIISNLDAAQTITLAVGTGITFLGAAAVIAATEAVELVFVVTNATVGAEAISVHFNQ